MLNPKENIDRVFLILYQISEYVNGPSAPPVRYFWYRVFSSRTLRFSTSEPFETYSNIRIHNTNALLFEDQTLHVYDITPFSQQMGRLIVRTTVPEPHKKSSEYLRHLGSFIDERVGFYRKICELEAEQKTVKPSAVEHWRGAGDRVK